MEVMDLDLATNEQMETIFKRNASRHGTYDECLSSSSDSADPDCPGTRIQKKKKKVTKEEEGHTKVDTKAQMAKVLTLLDQRIEAE